MKTRWREYCGANPEELEKALTKVLNTMEISFQKLKMPAYRAEVTMLGATREINAIKIKGPVPMTIRMVPVVGDPFMRVISRFTNDKALIQRASIVEIEPINESNKDFIGDIMSNAFKNLRQSPWQFSDLKFQLAIFLRLKIKRNWKCLLNS